MGFVVVPVMECALMCIHICNLFFSSPQALLFWSVCRPFS